jgi:hypothetical protein
MSAPAEPQVSDATIDELLRIALDVALRTVAGEGEGPGSSPSPSMIAAPTAQREVRHGPS